MQKSLNLKIEKIEKNLPANFIPFAMRCVKDSQVKILGESLDADLLTETIYQYTNSQDKAFFVASVESLQGIVLKESIVGCFLGESKLYPFSKIPIAVELYFSVLVEYRGMGIYKLLLKNFSEWGQSQGCRFLICGVNNFSSSSTEGAVNRLKKDGFLPFGQEFYKEL